MCDRHHRSLVWRRSSVRAAVCGHRLAGLCWCPLGGAGSALLAEVADNDLLTMQLDVADADAIAGAVRGYPVGKGARAATLAHRWMSDRSLDAAMRRALRKSIAAGTE